MNDILKIKIIKDLNKINKSIGSSLFQQSEINKIKAKFPKKYLNLLELIKNNILKNRMTNISTISKFSISDLNKIDVDFLEEISQFNNISVVYSPMFYEFVVQNEELISKISTVVQVLYIDTKEHIRRHQNDLFYIYDIDLDNARWKQSRQNKALMRLNRKEKLKKIEIEL